MYIIVIKKYRLAKGMSQIELAKKMSISQSMISDYERGIQVPSLDRLFQLSIILETPFDKLIHKVDNDA